MSTELALWTLPLAAVLSAGFGAGFAGGLFGIGGGFVVVPALMLVLPLLGGDSAHITHVAVGTSLATIIVTSLRSVQAHARRGAVEFEVLRSWGPWIVLGVGCGILLANHVSGKTMALLFGIGVSLMSLHFLVPGLSNRRIWNEMPSGYTRNGIASGLGMFSSLLGIGGGVLVTILMTLSGRSIHRSIGTAAGVGPIIAIPGMIGFMAIGLGAPDRPWGSIGYVNLPAALTIASVSIFAAPLGVAAAHKLPTGILRLMFGMYLLFVGYLMIRNGLR